MPYAAQSPPHRITLILLTSLSVLSLNMLLPSLPAIAADLNASYATASLAVSGYLAITAVVHLVLGRFADAYGRRRILLVTLTAFAGASLVCAIAQDITVFLVFRMLQAGIAAGGSLAMVIVRDTHEKEQSASVIGYIGMAMAIAPMLAPMLGGTLESLFGWRSIFQLYAILGIVMLIATYLDVGETLDPSSQSKVHFKGARWTILKMPRFWAYALCTAFSTSSFFIFLAGAPLVARSVFALPATWVGLLIGSITGGFMLGSFIAGRYSARHGLPKMMIAGRSVATAGIGLALSIYLVGLMTPFLFFACTAFVGIGNGITIPSSNTGAISVDPNLVGTASGLNLAINTGFGAAFTGLTGAIATPENAVPAVLALMFLTAAAGLMSALLVRRIEAGDLSGVSS